VQSSSEGRGRQEGREDSGGTRGDVVLRTVVSLRSVHWSAGVQVQCGLKEGCRSQPC
jgi:hypothetical protein